MNEEEIEIRKLLQAVADKGTYELGHIKWIQSIAERRAFNLREELKSLLDIRDCIHDL